MRRLLSFLFAASFVGAAIGLQAAETVHLYLKGSKTPSFNPDSKSGAFLAQATSFVMEKPGEGLTGSARRKTGTNLRTHKPIVIRKRIDKSTPLLLQALVTNEVIKTATFAFFRPAGNGQVEVYRVAQATGVTIKNIQKVQPKSASEPPMEEISFVFHTITWTVVSQKVPRRDFLDWQYADGN